MLSKIATLSAIVSALMGALLFYANAAYFPLDRGVVIEQKVQAIEKSLDSKLNTIIGLLEKQ